MFAMVILFSICAIITHAQPEIQFTLGGSQDDIGRMAFSTSDQGYILFSRTESYGQGEEDVIVTRTDSLGSVLWSNVFGSVDRDVLHFAKKDRSGGFIMGSNRNISALNDDWYVLRVDEMGNLVQESFFGGGPDDELMNVELTSDGGYLFCGSTRSFSTDEADVWIVKTDATMNEVWTKSFTTSGRDHGRTVIETASGEFMLLANRSPVGSSNMNLLLVLLNSIGDPQISMSIGGSAYDEGRDMIQTPDGNFLVLGYTKSYGAGGSDVLLFKVTQLGQVLWAKTYGGINDDEAFSLKLGHDGNILIAGTTNTWGSGGKDILLINVNQDGDVLNTFTTGGGLDEWQSYVSIAANDGYIISSASRSYGSGGLDILTIKTDKQGRSCCTEPVANLEEQTILLNTAAINLGISGGIANPTHSTNTGIISPTSALLCYDPLKIIGDEFVCENGGPNKYSITPLLDLPYTWSLPPGATISSSSGDSVIFVQFGSSSGYIIAGNAQGCDTDGFDSLYVTILTSTFSDAGSDEFVCAGASWDFKLSTVTPAASSYDSLRWTGGLGMFNDPTLLHPIYTPLQNESGDVLLTLTVYGVVPCGDDSDDMTLTITADPLGSFTMMPDNVVCLNETVIFESSGSSDISTWSWDFGDGNFSNDPNPTHAYSTAGSFTIQLIVSNSLNCNDTIVDQLIVTQVDVDLGEDISACDEFPILLDAGPGYNAYLWQDGTQSQTYMADHYGIYWVEVEQTGCLVADTVEIIEECAAQIWFPNVFTPNADGINDEFEPVYENITTYKLYIYNRWGQLLFESNHVDQGWDGTYKGRECPSGVYVFLSKYNDSYTQEIKQITGSLTILR